MGRIFPSGPSDYILVRMFRFVLFFNKHVLFFFVSCVCVLLLLFAAAAAGGGFCFSGAY